MPPNDAVLVKWWPTTQSIDLVRGPIEHVADATKTEFRRFAGRSPITSAWKEFADLDGVFSAAPHFANVVTFIAVLPTRSDWVALWNNCFLCNGYESLCWCLTRNHGLTSVHWSAHDETTSFQAGSHFTHRRWHEGQSHERSVACIREDQRWIFGATGEPLPEEDITAYSARRNRDRLGESRVMDLLARLGAAPWTEAFYAVPGSPVLLLSRDLPPAATTRDRDAVLKPQLIAPAAP